MRTTRASKRVCLGVCVAGIVLSGPARAGQPVSGFYVGGATGLALAADQATTLDVLMGVPVNTPHVTFGPGVSLLGQAGYGFGNGVRIELQADWRRNSASGGGTQSTVGVFANALYEFDLGDGVVRPYGGFGLGYENTSWSGVALTDTTGTIPIAVGGTGAGGFAFQLIIGAAFPIDAVPGLAVTAEYHLSHASTSRDLAAVASLPGGSVPTRLHAAADTSHELTVGVRYAFNQVPPPPTGEATDVPRVPGPVEPVARSYIVFFDWNSSALNARAQDVIAEAARASSHLAHTRIEVSGHNDRSPAEAGKIALSKARADAVADELVRWGVDKSIIDVHAFGDERPAVATPVGVREARNRRVEIVYE